MVYNKNEQDPNVSSERLRPSDRRRPSDRGRSSDRRRPSDRGRSSDRRRSSDRGGEQRTSPDRKKVQRTAQDRQRRAGRKAAYGKKGAARRVSLSLLRKYGSSDSVISVLDKIKWKKLIIPAALPVLILIVILCFGAFHGKSSKKLHNVSATLAADNEALTFKNNDGMLSAVSESREYRRDNSIVCLDAGHGGSDPGADRGSIYEKDQALSVTLIVKEYLEAKGYKVVLTRSSDTDVDLAERIRIAEAANAGVLVSIHRNYYKQSASVKGIECWIHSSGPADARGLSDRILGELDRLKLSDNRGVKTGTNESSKDNYRINTSKCTSCILELGFITNSSDDMLVTGRRRECAKAIADGIDKYIKSI